MDRMIFRVGSVLAALFVCSLLTHWSAQGRDLWSVATDPFGVYSASAELSSSLERTLSQLSALEDKGDNDVNARLEQVRSIVREALSGVDGAVEKAVKKARELEEDVDKRAINLIYRAECVGVQYDQEIQQTFANIIDELIKTNATLKIAGYDAGSLKLRLIPLTQVRLYVVAADRPRFSSDCLA